MFEHLDLYRAESGSFNALNSCDIDFEESPQPVGRSYSWLPEIYFDLRDDNVLECDQSSSVTSIPLPESGEGFQNLDSDSEFADSADSADSADEPKVEVTPDFENKQRIITVNGEKFQLFQLGGWFGPAGDPLAITSVKVHVLMTDSTNLKSQQAALIPELIRAAGPGGPLEGKLLIWKTRDPLLYSNPDLARQYSYADEFGENNKAFTLYCSDPEAAKEVQQYVDDYLKKNNIPSAGVETVRDSYNIGLKGNREGALIPEEMNKGIKEFAEKKVKEGAWKEFQSVDQLYDQSGKFNEKALSRLNKEFGMDGKSATLTYSDGPNSKLMLLSNTQNEKGKYYSKGRENRFYLSDHGAQSKCVRNEQGDVVEGLTDRPALKEISRVLTDKLGKSYDPVDLEIERVAKLSPPKVGDVFVFDNESYRVVGVNRDRTVLVPVDVIPFDEDRRYTDEQLKDKFEKITVEANGKTEVYYVDKTSPEKVYIADRKSDGKWTIANVGAIPVSTSELARRLDAAREAENAKKNVTEVAPHPDDPNKTKVIQVQENARVLPLKYKGEPIKAVVIRPTAAPSPTVPDPSSPDFNPDKYILVNEVLPTKNLDVYHYMDVDTGRIYEFEYAKSTDDKPSRISPTNYEGAVVEPGLPVKYGDKTGVALTLPKGRDRTFVVRTDAKRDLSTARTIPVQGDIPRNFKLMDYESYGTGPLYVESETGSVFMKQGDKLVELADLKVVDADKQRCLPAPDNPTADRNRDVKPEQPQNVRSAPSVVRKGEFVIMGHRTFCVEGVTQVGGKEVAVLRKGPSSSSPSVAVNVTNSDLSKNYVLVGQDGTGKNLYVRSDSSTVYVENGRNAQTGTVSISSDPALIAVLTNRMESKPLSSNSQISDAGVPRRVIAIEPYAGIVLISQPPGTGQEFLTLDIKESDLKDPKKWTCIEGPNKERYYMETGRPGTVYTCYKTDPKTGVAFLAPNDGVKAVTLRDALLSPVSRDSVVRSALSDKYAENFARSNKQLSDAPDERILKDTIDELASKGVASPEELKEAEKYLRKTYGEVKAQVKAARKVISPTVAEPIGKPGPTNQNQDDTKIARDNQVNVKYKPGGGIGFEDPEAKLPGTKKESVAFLDEYIKLLEKAKEKMSPEERAEVEKAIAEARKIRESVLASKIDAPPGMKAKIAERLKATGAVLGTVAAFAIILDAIHEHFH